MKLLFLLLIAVNSFAQIRIITPTTANKDVTSNVRAAITDINTKIVKIQGGLISGPIDFAGKVLQVERGTKISGATIISNAIIEADKEQVIFESGVTLDNVRSSNGVFYASWYGANGNDTEPDDMALQKGLDYVISNNVGLKTFELSPGTYRLNKGLVVWRDNDKDGNPEFVNIKIRGMIGAYMGTSNEVTLLCQNPGSFGLAIQRGKGVIVENINIQGLNTLNYSAQQTFNPASTYLANSSLRTNFKSPHAGLVLDFAGETVTGTDRYPGFESYYDRIRGNGGSTDCKFYNVSVSGFVVGIILSPNSNTQNNEAHVFDGIWITSCRDGFVTTNSQERTVQCRNFKFWNSVKTCFRTNGYGLGRGEVPQIESANFAGVYELFHFTGSGGYFPVVSINNVYAENFYWLGNIQGITVQFNGSHFAFAVLNWIGEKSQDFIAVGSTMTFMNSILISYGDTRAPYNIRARTKFVNCYLQNPVAYLTTNWTQDFYEIEYEGCSFYSQNGYVSSASFESFYDGYVNLTYGSQTELATYNKEYASYKNSNFSQYRKIKTPLVRKTSLSRDELTVEVNGNKAICSVRVAPNTLIYTTNLSGGMACMTSTDKPFEFDHVVNSMTSGKYSLFTISMSPISLVGFCFNGRLIMERGVDAGLCGSPSGTVVANYEYEEWGFSDYDPSTSDYVPNGVAFTKGSIYKNRTGTPGIGWICTKSGVKGSFSPPTFKPQ